MVLLFVKFICKVNFLQIPREVPHPNTNSPIDLTKLEDVIIYIILPLAVIILLLIERKKRNTKE
jgi:hypothetical protein